MGNDVNYESIKQKVPDFFCVRNLREIYKGGSYNFDLSFVDFLMCIEDFYTFVYSTRLSKTSWLLFTWLRTLVRYDGFVKLSYKDVSRKFCENKSVISKPTFFKCINELDEFGLVKKISNKILFDTKYQKDVNTYIVISKVDDILPLLDGLSNQLEFYNILRNVYFDGKPKEPKKKLNTTPTTEYSYEESIKEYHLAKNELEDFFVFLGSGNKSGKIAISRKTKIMNVIMDLYPHEDDLVYAIGQTISKGVKTEKYFFAILRNMLNGEEDEEVIVDEKQKELKDKYTQKKQQYYDGSPHMDSKEYENAKDIILSRQGGYLEILNSLKNVSNANAYENKLLDVCTKLGKKFTLHKEYEKYRGKRINILSPLNISECMDYDNHWNECIYWVYDDDSIVPPTQIKKLMKSNPDVFVFNKFQHINERMNIDAKKTN